MKKAFFMIFTILILITSIVGYLIYNYRLSEAKYQKNNKLYQSYYGKEVVGTELISIVNKTIDINEKNNIQKDENGYYINNNQDSIQIDIIFNYKDDVKLLKMEDIDRGGIKSFINVYDTNNFKCTSIEYHNRTKNISKLVFEEI